MHARYFAALLVASAASVFASPAAIEHREPQGVIDDITSAAGNIGDAITSAGGAAGSVITSVGGGVATDITSLGGQFTSAAGEVFSTVTSFGGKAYTVVTSEGGAANHSRGRRDSELSPPPWDRASSTQLQISSALLLGSASIVGSVLLGAFITV
ncbi:hypothetical protein FA13DRAFT_1788738 [Coprinellus micaceus]|uniref:Uncharacterized protein n=1 Tax=Coprinellus micaceus TaxID=71717 RepID=A0A4Y7TLT4_COPMI|nr:hypothetical protein FA13DRAFT_1788738 [Coprinellus micaceus]